MKKKYNSGVSNVSQMKFTILKNLSNRLFLFICIYLLSISVSIGQTGGPSCPSITGLNANIQIPVIVHVMYDDGFQNVEYQTVVDMINTINNQLASVEIDGQTVDISLYLVENGTCTPGYEKIKVTNASITGGPWDDGVPISEDIRIKENNVWDPDKYLNIWIVHGIHLFTGSLKAYSTMPLQNQYIDGITICHDQLEWLVYYFGNYSNIYNPWHKQSEDCEQHNGCINGDYCDDIMEVFGFCPYPLNTDPNSEFYYQRWVNGFFSTYIDYYPAGNGNYYLNALCFPIMSSGLQWWHYPADNFMAKMPQFWSKFSNDQYRRMIICYNGSRSNYATGGDDAIDLSENVDHSTSELLSKLGFNTMQELCQSEEKFNIVLGGNLILDSSGNPICFKNGTKFKMLESARITVQNQTTLNLDNVHLFSCDEFWDRILIKAGSKINISNNCLIEDGYNSISAEKGSTINAENSVFNNNFISINLTNSGTGDKSIIKIAGCDFKSDADFYKNEDGSIFYRPLSAIMINDQRSVNLRADENNRNTFNRLRNGILAYQSSIYVYYSDFTDIAIESNIFPQNNSILLDRDGYAVKVYNGNTVSVVRYNTMDEVVYPIGGYKGVIVARNNAITNSDHAILGYKLNSAKIQDNIIFADKKGIFLNDCNMMYGLNYINNNYVTLDYNGISGGSSVAVGIDMELTPKADIYNNFITIGANKAGLQLQNADATIFEDNDVWVDYENNYRETGGISVLNSEGVTINNNDVVNQEATDNNNLGIFVAGSYKGTFECNHTTEFNYGMHYATTCDDSYLYGNHFFSNNKDLVVGSSGYATNVANDYTVIGPQGDWTDNQEIGFGNKWIPNLGVAHHSGTANTINRSRFLVRDDDKHPQGYLPRTIEAASEWFYNQANINMSPCTGEPGSDLPPLCINLISKIQSVDTIRSIDPCKKMMWQYKYFKELIKMKKKGLLTDQCKGYLLSQQNNVLLKIGEAGFTVDSIARLNSTTAYNLSQMFSATIVVDSLYSAGQYGTVAWDRAWSDYQSKYTTYQISYDAEIIRDRAMTDSTLTVLNNISVVDSCLKVLVKVYKIRLYVMDGDTLQAADKDWLRQTALECPDAIGEGVYIARSLLSMYEPENEYPELYQCADAGIGPRESEIVPAEAGKMKVYPNPASDEINIEISKSETETGTVTIIDIDGKKVYYQVVEKYDSNVKISTGTWSNGIYFIQYTGADPNEIIEKIIINR